MDDEFKKVIKSHTVYHKFQKWVTKNFGKDLYGEWQYFAGTKYRYRFLDEGKLSQRLVGYEVMCKVERYVKRYLPEIKIIRCDDSVHAGSDILMIPHPKHGITIIFIPQCTNVQNQFFLYDQHHKEFVDTLIEMKSVYQSYDEDEDE